MTSLRICAITAGLLGCTIGTEPDAEASGEEIAIRLRVEVEEPVLVPRHSRPVTGEAQPVVDRRQAIEEDSLMCSASGEADTGR